jgi:hypothetical protein
LALDGWSVNNTSYQGTSPWYGQTL